MKPLPLDKAGRITLGSMILKKLDFLPFHIREYKKSQRVVRSEAPFGFAFYVDEKEQAVIDTMETHGYTVYTVIKGRYRIGCFGDIMDATSYLYVSNEDVDRYNINLQNGDTPLSGIIAPYENNQYFVMANVYGFEQEYGKS